MNYYCRFLFLFFCFQLIYRLNGVSNVNLSSVDCICGTDPHCQAPVAIYGVDFAFTSKMSYTIDYIVPYSITGCSRFSSLLLSQFECLYVNSNCFQTLMNYTQDTYIRNVEYPSWFDPHALVYDPTSSRYPPDTSISEIIKEIMLDRWNPSSSYDRFYELCAPSYCAYSERIRPRTIFGAITILISMIGGLTISLSLITFYLVKFIYSLLNKMKKQQQNKQESGKY